MAGRELLFQLPRALPQEWLGLGVAAELREAGSQQNLDPRGFEVAVRLLPAEQLETLAEIGLGFGGTVRGEQDDSQVAQWLGEIRITGVSFDVQRLTSARQRLVMAA